MQPTPPGDSLRLNMADVQRSSGEVPPPPRQPAGQPPASSEFESAGVHIVDYIKILYKRRWTALTAFILVFVGTVVYTFTATPVYEARAKLLIESDDPNYVDFKNVLEQSRRSTDYYQTQYDLLKSRALVRKTLDSLHLWQQPAIVKSRESAGVVGKATHWVAGALGQTPAPDVAADETVAQAIAIDGVLGALTVAPVRNSRVVDLRFRSSDPDMAMRIVNAHARGYIAQSLEYRFLSSKEATDWLGDRLKEQRTQVETAESALQKYREQNDAIPMEDRENIVVQKLTDLNAAVTRAKTERIEKDSIYNQMKDLQVNSASLDTFPAILGNSFIQQQKSELAALQAQYAQLSEKLGEKHPDIRTLKTAIENSQAKLQAEIGKVVQSVRNDYLAAKAREDSLAGALETQKREALAMNRAGINYAVLKREVDSSRQVYNSLLQRAKETTVSGELRTSNIRLIDPAERPRAPASPNKRVNLMLGLVGGGLLSLVWAFGLDYMDSRIRTPDQIREFLRVPNLGLIPAMSVAEMNGTDPLLGKGLPASVAEALRVLRTNVLFSSAEPGMRSVVVTSTGPGEGKTLVSTNLAVAFAQAGQRVLLIDADLRRPRVHSIFNVAQEPGLSNLMIGSCKASEAVRKTDTPGLWVMPSGRTPPNPAELLGSVRFRDFLTSLSDHFTWIVIDTPPVLAVTDASLVAHTVTGVLLVVGSEMTSRHAARVAMDQLESVKAKFFGAVLNRVSLHRNPYYYSNYYRREYHKYYVEAGQPKA